MRLRPLAKDLGLTSLTGLAAIAAGLVTVSLVGRLMGIVAVTEYLLVRRVVMWLRSAGQLGLDIALPRYVARTASQGTGERESYFIGALLLMTAFSVVIVGGLFAGRRAIADWVFDGRPAVNLLIASAILLFGFVVHSAVYGYYRGRLDMVKANALQVVSIVILAPLVVVALYRIASIATIISCVGALTILASAAFSIPIIAAYRRGPDRALVARGKEMLQFGFPRTWGNLAWGGLMALPALIAARQMSMASIAPLLLAGSVLTGVAALASPIGLILLSKVSMMLVQGRLDDTSQHLTTITAGVLSLSGFVCVQVLIYADVLLRIWVGPTFVGGANVVRIVILAVPFYVYFIAMRSAVDAASVFPFNSRNVALALGAFLVIVGPLLAIVPAQLRLEALAAGWSASFVVLAWLTARCGRRLLGVRVSAGNMASTWVAILAIGLATLLARVYVGSGGIAEAALTELVACGAFVGWHVLAMPSWLAASRRQIFSS